ncbi:SDR family oxidoreductase [Acinetobacter baumannii]
MYSKKNVLLTGATGFIGSYLLAELLVNENIGKIYILSRKLDKNNQKERLFTAFEKFSVPHPERLMAATNIVMIEGDITQPRLGISDLISMAQKGRDKVINFVSTLGSAAKKDADGRYVEAFPDNAILNSDMGYLLSKWEAEKLLEKFQNQGGKVYLFRLGYISGHSRTGASLFADNQFMLFIKSCIQLGYAPILPRTINFTPVDYTTAIMALPQYMSEGGDVLNLFNYSGLINWEDIVSWLNLRGYKIETIEFYEWQKKLLVDSENNALFRFLPLYGVEGSHNKILRFGREIDKFDFQNTVTATECLDYKLPVLKYELLDTYLRYLQSVEFLPIPQVVNAA